MLPVRTLRRSFAMFTIAMLVFAQAIVAAYACVLPDTPPVAQPCHEPDSGPAPDALCKAHCQVGQQTVDQPKPLATPDLATPVLVVAMVDPADRMTRAPVRGTFWLARGGAPPPLLLTGRLRI
jgi:hypothetical protein